MPETLDQARIRSSRLNTDTPTYRQARAQIASLIARGYSGPWPAWYEDQAARDPEPQGDPEDHADSLDDPGRPPRGLRRCG